MCIGVAVSTRLKHARFFAFCLSIIALSAQAKPVVFSTCSLIPCAFPPPVTDPELLSACGQIPPRFCLGLGQEQGNRFGWRHAALPVRLHQVIESAKLSADIPAKAARFRATWAVVQMDSGFLNELRSWQRGVQKRRLAERAAGGSSCSTSAAKAVQPPWGQPSALQGCGEVGLRSSRGPPS